MKTAEEWCDECNASQKDSFVEFIQRVQSDAFHAGKLEGYSEAAKAVSQFEWLDKDFNVQSITDHMEKNK